MLGTLTDRVQLWVMIEGFFIYALRVISTYSSLQLAINHVVGCSILTHAQISSLRPLMNIVYKKNHLNFLYGWPIAQRIKQSM